MIKNIDITDRKNAKEVLQLQLSSYKIEADIIGYQDLPPLKDTTVDLQRSGENFWGYFIEGKLGGVISFKVDQSEIDIHRLIVSPYYLRQGIAQELLDYVEANSKAASIKVSTASKNEPAITFYSKNGFKRTDEVEINPQLSLSSFEKVL
ncbi:GNAT family N-acetyltransferase [Jeotgalibacillus salarius]|uniref:GNAT family N-acetyltransferase n=1 Tax=Jeotgalibacillus salarius TaxID=546023 RepID=A0A4Y8LAZ6_9BACL|nr:GNAT family N-acetyltransferase [Jeotgalibacillus salarius]TFD99491.1 GNAT family N-acetyltransferase [Jeotgalibacillus salarius]